MPSAEDLPEPLQPLTRRQAFQVTVRHWTVDVAQLIGHLQRVPGLDRPHAVTQPPANATRSEARAKKIVGPAEREKPTAERSRPTALAPREQQEEAISAEHEQALPPLRPPEAVDSADGRGPGPAGIAQRPQVPRKFLVAVGTAVVVVLLAFFLIRKQPDSHPAPTSHPAAAPSSTRDAKDTTPPVQAAEPSSGAVTTFKATESFRDCDQCPEVVVVPPGKFIMGSPAAEKGHAEDEGPQHAVTIAQPFAVSKYEVTFDEWDACVAAGGCSRKPEDRGWGRGRQPVIKVSWEDAQTYVAWLSNKTGKPYRLLSEAEWEYAARAGTTTRYPWGDEPGSLHANFDGSGSRWSLKQTAPVGSFGPNPFGLHDVIGNVYELVQDCWNDSYIGAPSDGSAWLKGDCGQRVLRGGAWNDRAEYARAANRYTSEPGNRHDYLGFRVARTL